MEAVIYFNYLVDHYREPEYVFSTTCLTASWD